MREPLSHAVSPSCSLSCPWRFPDGRGLGKGRILLTASGAQGQSEWACLCSPAWAQSGKAGVRPGTPGRRSLLPACLLVCTFSLLPSQSRMVRNETPYLIWTTRRDVLDCRFLAKDQMINHYARAGSFTTKVGSWGTPAPGWHPHPCCPCLGKSYWESKSFAPQQDRQSSADSGSAPSPTRYLACVDRMTEMGSPFTGSLEPGQTPQQEGPSLLNRVRLADCSIPVYLGFSASSFPLPALVFSSLVLT